MRPKYSSPGAELVNSSHCKRCHLLLAFPHASFGFEAFGVAVAAVVGVVAETTVGERAALAIATVVNNVNNVGLTCNDSPL